MKFETKRSSTGPNELEQIGGLKLLAIGPCKPTIEQLQQGAEVSADVSGGSAWPLPRP